MCFIATHDVSTAVPNTLPIKVIQSDWAETPWFSHGIPRPIVVFSPSSQLTPYRTLLNLITKSFPYGHLLNNGRPLIHPRAITYITPLVYLQDNLHLLELFHGPSYSFKDCMSPTVY